MISEQKRGEEVAIGSSALLGRLGILTLSLSAAKTSQKSAACSIDRKSRPIVFKCARALYGPFSIDGTLISTHGMSRRVGSAANLTLHRRGREGEGVRLPLLSI